MLRMSNTMKMTRAELEASHVERGVEKWGEGERAGLVAQAVTMSLVALQHEEADARGETIKGRAHHPPHRSPLQRPGALLMPSLSLLVEQSLAAIREAQGAFDAAVTEAAQLVRQAGQQYADGDLHGARQTIKSAGDCLYAIHGDCDAVSDLEDAINNPRK
jgi:hypothetical protein